MLYMLCRAFQSGENDVIPDYVLFPWTEVLVKTIKRMNAACQQEEFTDVAIQASPSWFETLPVEDGSPTWASIRRRLDDIGDIGVMITEDLANELMTLCESASGLEVERLEVEGGLGWKVTARCKYTGTRAFTETFCFGFAPVCFEYESSAPEMEAVSESETET